MLEKVKSGIKAITRTKQNKELSMWHLSKQSMNFRNEIKGLEYIKNQLIARSSLGILNHGCLTSLFPRNFYIYLYHLLYSFFF